MKRLLLALGCLPLVLPLRADSTDSAHAASSAPAETHAAPAHDPAAPADSDPPAALPEAPADPAASQTAPPAAPHSDEPTPAEELASLLRIGDAKTLAQDWASAELAFGQVLVARPRATDEQIRAALLGLARAHRGARRLTKACAVYERYVKMYPADDRLPLVYLELGRCLRALGAHRLAIARFYSVINSTLKVPEEGADTYRQLARTAQFEIAETYFQSGDYTQAHRFYSRLSLLDLAPDDRARAAFKSAYALNLAGDLEKTVTQLRAYLSLSPDGENAPEARHLLSVALRRLGRNQESLAAVLDLLRTEQARTSADPASWTYWQRKTGNQLANEFYEQGDIATALAIYQCLRELGGPPDWLLPVRYQIGLCQERLGQTALARETYQGLVDSLRDSTPAPEKSNAVTQDLSTMVDWRLQHLDWLEPIEKRLGRFGAPDAPVPIPAPVQTSATASPAAAAPL